MRINVPARVAVTGADGFIGRHVVTELLTSGCHIDAIVHKRGVVSFTASDRVTVHELDLLDHVALRSWIERHCPKRFLHLAWVTTPGHYWTSLENNDWLRSGTVLLDGLSAVGCRRVVMIGSCAEYDWSTGAKCRESSTPVRPSTTYGQAKNALRERLEAFGRTGAMSTAWARLFFPYGPGEARSRLIPSVILSLLAGERAKCTEGTQVRDYIYIGDVASALVCLMDSEITGPINIASGVPIRIRDIVLRLANRLGRSDAVDFGAIALPPGDPPFLVADISRLTGELGWKPRVGLAEGLDLAISWWRKAV